MLRRYAGAVNVIYGSSAGLTPNGNQLWRQGNNGVNGLAAKLGLPVLPVTIWGVDAFNRPADVYIRRLRPVIHVRVTPPQTVAARVGDRLEVRAAADAIMLLIARQLPPALRGAYREGTERHERGVQALAAGHVRPAVC